MPLWETGVSVVCSHTGAGLFAYGAFAGLFSAGLFANGAFAGLSAAGLFAQILVEHKMRKH